MENTVLVIAGPTGSGKSGLALHLAEQKNGTVINADAMQVYDLYPRLTAQPEEEDKRRAPHLLYSTITPPESGTAESWMERATAAIKETFAAGQLPILAGGTGLYLEFLMHGRSAIPDVPEECTAQAREEYKKLGGVAILEKLKAIDPSAGNLNPGDSSRVSRAYEVYLATGKGLGYWQKESFEAPKHGWNFKTIFLLPDRERLYANINQRFEKMIAHGALEEVKAAMARNIPADHLAQKAHGARELQAVIEGRMKLAEAVATSQQITRNYAKRQFTWFRNRFMNKERAAGRAVLSLKDADISKNSAEVLDFTTKA
jgi:tRNA dimethylallyltransferase